MLRFGADESIRGRPEGEPVQTPAFAARRNGNPGIADLVDLEASLRALDPTRRSRQQALEMSLEEFRESHRLKAPPP